jgi:LDH2 family malate/lactate/ureidoglycolate dehydrogenase
VVAIAADAFRALGDTLDDADQLRDLIHAVSPTQGFDSVVAPGDPEQLKRLRNLDAIEIGAGAWEKIQAAARRAGVPDAAQL